MILCFSSPMFSAKDIPIAMACKIMLASSTIRITSPYFLSVSGHPQALSITSLDHHADASILDWDNVSEMSQLLMVASFHLRTLLAFRCKYRKCSEVVVHVVHSDIILHSQSPQISPEACFFANAMPFLMASCLFSALTTKP